MSTENINIINSKIALRIDDLSNWNTHGDQVLMGGEAVFVRNPNGHITMRIGDGVSQFNELDDLYGKNNLIIGTNCNDAEKTGNIAAGYHVSALTDFSHALGAWASATDNFTFVWNGAVTDSWGNPYESHGEGSFNINPLSGTAGFFIGEQSLEEIVNDATAADVLSVTLEDLYYTKSEIDDMITTVLNTEI